MKSSRVVSVSARRAAASCRDGWLVGHWLAGGLLAEEAAVAIVLVAVTKVRVAIAARHRVRRRRLLAAEGRGSPAWTRVGIAGRIRAQFDRPS